MPSDKEGGVPDIMMPTSKTPRRTASNTPTSDKKGDKGDKEGGVPIASPAQ